MRKYILLLGLMLYVVCNDSNEPKAGGTLGGLIEEHFGNDPNDCDQVIKNGMNTVPNSNGGNASPKNVCKEGECVSYYQCGNGTVITNGKGLFDIRFGETCTTEERPCTGYLQTCCSHRSAVPVAPPVKIIEGCGYRNTKGAGFGIAGGKDNEAEFGEFPWTVAILMEDTALDHVINLYQCGGSLITPKTVLTVAHCVLGKVATSLKIRAGEWDTQTKDEPFGNQDRKVSEYIIHEHYDIDPGSLINDVALLFLLEPVDIAPNVNTICLPPQNLNFDYERCFASGWGKNVYGKEGRYQSIMKRIELPIVPRDKCLSELRQSRLGTNFELYDSFICAGGELGIDTCQGDGGSPLVCPIKNTTNQYYQVGMVAWGLGCGDVYPAVYVNVPKFRNWIDEKLQHKQMSTTAYLPKDTIRINVDEH